MTIKVFVGTEPKTEIARKVLEYSIKKNTKYPTQIIPMLGDDWRIKTPNGSGTGFSLLRWDIPSRCNFQGAAIYLDADMLCLGDIADLYQADAKYPNDKSSVWCTYQTSKWFKENTPETSCMLIDCEKARNNQWQLKYITNILNQQPKGDRRMYVRIMRALDHQFAPQQIPDSWNRLNSIKEPTNILHYTKEDQQPWYFPSNKHTDIWKQYLIEAILEGFVQKAEIEKAIADFIPHTKKARGTGMHSYWKCVL